MPPSWACCGASKEGGLVSAAGASEANVISVSESYRNFEQRQVAVGGPTPERRRGRPPESAPVLQADLRRDLPLLKIATRLSLLSYTEDVKELQVCSAPCPMRLLNPAHAAPVCQARSANASSRRPQDRYWSVHEAGKADGSGLEEVWQLNSYPRLEAI